MKTTIDLPDVLVKAARQRALHEGRTFRELVADGIRQGLNEQGDLDALLALERHALLDEDLHSAGLRI